VRRFERARRGSSRAGPGDDDKGEPLLSRTTLKHRTTLQAREQYNKHTDSPAQAPNPPSPPTLSSLTAATISSAHMTVIVASIASL